MTKIPYLLLLILPFFFSCSTLKEISASFKTPHGFIPLDTSVQVENNDDMQFAQEIQHILPALIDSVQIKFHHQFKTKLTIYVCNTNKSFCNYAGSKFPGPRAKVTPKGLFISPRLKGSPDWQEIIYHELSHVMLFQHLGPLHYITIPLWFHEGLATDVSNGGGSGTINDSAAIAEIMKGHHFYPHENFIQSYLSRNDIPPWMEYRQYMLFVRFLRDGREKEFNHLINAVFDKQSFATALHKAYGMNIKGLWNTFVEQLKNSNK